MKQEIKIILLSLYILRGGNILWYARVSFKYNIWEKNIEIAYWISSTIPTYARAHIGKGSCDQLCKLYGLATEGGDRLYEPVGTWDLQSVHSRLQTGELLRGEKEKERRVSGEKLPCTWNGKETH
jgi:hypothetical protein